MIDFWAAALALTLLLYVLLDGFDLGIGILFGLTRSESHKHEMVSAISPIWDGNETWLVLTGTILFGAFPVVYSLLLSAYYIPIFLMLGALIFRGVAFEFRERSTRLRWLWDSGFVAGSLVAAFVQGATVGALVGGLPNDHGRFTGHMFGWLSPFSILCGIGLCIGYALIGAGWLVKKTEGETRAVAYRQIPRLLLGLLAFLAIAFVYSLIENLPVMARWFDRPVLFVFPLFGFLGVVAICYGTRTEKDSLPFAGAVILFMSAFGTLAVSFLPYMVPFSLTIKQAAAPASALSFMFWGAGVFVLPLTLAYTVLVYHLFKGKVRRGQEYH